VVEINGDATVQKAKWHARISWSKVSLKDPFSESILLLKMLPQKWLWEGVCSTERFNKF